MIHKTFDNRTPAIISPENYRSGKRFADTCILTFSCEVRDNALEQFPAQKVGALNSVNGPVPIYVMPYKGRNVAFFMCPITAPVAAMSLEEASQLLGATNFIMFGSCGVLDSDIAQGKLIVPTHAYRDEGVSYHYRPADAPYIPIPTSDFIAQAFEEMGLPHVQGRTWTTDAFYRETRGNMEARRAEGCIAVEMECAALQAVCDFRGYKYYPFLISSDLLDSPQWDRRILGNDGERAHQLKTFYVALELAAKL
jgi:uridine phosphorylase